MFRYFFDALDALEAGPAGGNLATQDLHAEVVDLDFIQQSAGIGFWDLDTARMQVRWSYGMEAIYGLPKGGFQGTPEDFVSRIHPDDVAHVLLESQAAIDQRRPFDIRFRIVRPDNSVRWIASRGNSRFGADGAYVGASGFQLDITEPQRREQQLLLQAEVLTNMAEGVLLVDAGNGNILYANPRYEAMLGYAPGALTGLPVSVVNGPAGQDPPGVAGDIVAALHSKGLWRGEVKSRRADGSEIWSSSSISELHYGGVGKIWVGVNSDITERRLAQAARDEAVDRLQRLAHSVLDQIEDERRALSREVHDQLGAALTGMHMQLEDLAVKLQPLSPALAQQARGIMAQATQTQRAARDISSRLRPALLDDLGLTATCRWYAKEWSRQSGVAIKTRFSALPREPRPSIATDMFRVLQELLTNVARHAGARSVRIALSTEESLLVLKVDDDGCGFAAQTPTEGLGLMGVRERLRHRGGMLHLRSDASGAHVTATMQLQSPR
jgi:PAS domain S-box-containing protein